MDLTKWSFNKCAILIGVLAVCTCPWVLVTPESAAGLALFIQIYSAFLGPIFAVMVVDYYVIRKRKLNLDEIYKKDGAFSGFNLAGLIATGVGALAAISVVEIGWFLSLLPAGIVYYILMTKTKLGTKYLFGTSRNS